MPDQHIANRNVADALNDALKRTGTALLERRPNILTGTVLKVHLRAVRAYLERAERE